MQATNIILSAVLAGAVLIIAIGAVVIAAWLLLVSFYLPLTNDGIFNSVILYAILEFFSQLLYGLFLIPSSFIVAGTEIVTNIRENLTFVVILGGLSTAAFVWLEYHPQIIKTYLEARQCSIRPIWDSIIMPIANLVRIVYNVVIQFVNFAASVIGYLQYGAPVILLKCTAAALSISQLFAYVGVFLQTLFTDFNNWIIDQPLSNPFVITNSVEAFANIFIAFIPVLDCFCKGLHFLYVWFETLLGLPSLAAALNFAWIAVINLFQIPFYILQTPSHIPDLTNITLNSCGAVIFAGEFLQEGIFLTAETFYGLITNETDLPPQVAEALSIRWSFIITHPICGVFRVVNITIVAAFSYENITAADGSGVRYFQFGEPLDELKVAAFQIGDFFDILDNQAQSLVNSSLFALIDIIAFLFEWVIGNIFYEAYGGPLPASFGLFNQTTPSGAGLRNFWKYYFADYWFKAMPFGENMTNYRDNSTISFPIKIGNYTYSSAIDSFFRNVFRASQSLGDLLGLFDVPLGQLVRHFINILAAALLAIANQLSYSYCGITFDCSNMPITENKVNVDLLFNEAFFFAGAAGDLFRQFDNASCQNMTNDANKTILCLTGNIVETTLDVFVLVAQEIIHFVQDLLTVPTGQLKLCLFETTNVSNAQCLRIPDFTTAITELDDALCDFGYAVTSLVPYIPALACSFAPEANVTRTCSTVQTCLGFEFCSILRFVPIILQIINSLFIKIISGTSFKGFSDFLTFSIGLLVNQFAVVLEQFATFLDCSICAADPPQPPGTLCSSPVFDVVRPIAEALRELAKIFTNIFLQFIKLVLLLIVGFFAGNPVTAIIDFIFGFIQTVFIGIGSALIDFIDQLFNKIGLGFLGTFIKILYTGFCTVIEIIINAIIVVLKVVTFGHFPHDYVQFCCSSSNCIPQAGTRKRMDMPITVGNITMVNMDNWLKLVSDYPFWPKNDPCNASVIAYGKIPFTELGTYQMGELLFCGAKLIHSANRTDNQTALPAWRCEAMITQNMDKGFDSFSISDQFTVMECAFTRLIVEGFRHQLNISWLPQDLGTNPLRALYFGAGLAQGALLNTQFFSDKKTPPATILTEKYQSFWRNMHVDVSHYASLKTVDDVIRFKEDLTLLPYFEANHASQHDATVYIATGIWAITGNLVKGIANMSHAFSDNITDAGTYLSFNYSLDNPTYAGIGTIWGMFSQGFGALNNLTTYWSDPANYKKRSEAYTAVSGATYGMYRLAVKEIQNMAAEYMNNKVYESTHYYNQTCGSEEQCRATGVVQFREQYERSIRGEDEYQGATSLVYKMSSWWAKSDFTRYPIRNPRYHGHRINVPPNLEYQAEDGTWLPETRMQRFWRYIEVARKGTHASRRRWLIMESIFGRTRDKVYTQVLKHHFKKEKYALTTHHINMQNRYNQEAGSAGVYHQQHPVGRRVCDPYSGVCTIRYDFAAFEYDQDHRVDNAIDMRAVALVNPIHIEGNPTFTIEAFTANTSFFDTPCIKEISFPCSYPLECDGNATTTLCVQCLYLQAGIDRTIAAIDQFLTYYGPGGQFSSSLTLAYHFFNYTLDPNATAVVGDSPELHVALFPRQGEDFWDFLLQSARYFGDDTPNKTRFDDFINQANGVIFNTTGGNDNVTNSSLFTRQYPDTINGQVFSVVSVLFADILQFFYNVYLYIVGASQSESQIVNFLGEKFLFCDWYVGDDFNGSNKHFSIGEMVLMTLVVYVVFQVLSVIFFGFGFLGMLLPPMLTTTIMGSLFLTIYADWAYFCSPGLPVILANDILYFFAYNLWPKCSYFWGFMMTSDYNNNNCYTCISAQALTLTHCVHNEGFFDYVYNIAFILDVFFPSFVNYLRTSTGFARVIANLPPFNARLNFFVNLNLDDPFLWARYQGCNWIVTMPANLMIFTLYIAVLAIVSVPVLVAIYTIALWLWSLVSQMIVILLLLVNEIATNPFLTPHYYDDGSPYNNNYGENDADDQQGDADGEDTTTQTRVSLATPIDREAEYMYPDRRGTKRAMQPLRRRPRPNEYRSKPNGWGFSRVYNIFAFFWDNYFGDRKAK